MAEGQKRFPWWLATCAVALAILTVALCWYIRTARRPGLLTSGYEQIKVGMSRDEVHRILGSPDAHFPPDRKDSRREEWDARSVGVVLTFEDNHVAHKWIGYGETNEVSEHVWWADLYYWAEWKWKGLFGHRR